MGIRVETCQQTWTNGCLNMRGLATSVASLAWQIAQHHSASPGAPQPNVVWHLVWLVVLTIWKNMKVNGKDYLIPYIMENKKCSKPPTKCDNIANRIAKPGAFHAWPWNAPQKSPIDPVDPIHLIFRWNDHPMIFQWYSNAGCWMMLDAFLLQLGNMSTLEQALLLKRLKDIESHDMKNMKSCSETLESPCIKKWQHAHIVRMSILDHDSSRSWTSSVWAPEWMLLIWFDMWILYIYVIWYVWYDVETWQRIIWHSGKIWKHASYDNSWCHQHPQGHRSSLRVETGRCKQIPKSRTCHGSTLPFKDLS